MVFDSNMRAKLEKLYQAYGFEISKDGDDVGIFTYKKSRYFGVDLIPYKLDDETHLKINKIKDKYSNAGFAANIKEFVSYEDAELELYKSFFSYQSTKSRLIRKFDEFKKKQTLNLLGNEYKYIESPYELNSEDDQQEAFFDVLKNIISQPKPQLIIIEAAAGYGKTCSSYELLKYYLDKVEYTTPIFTELSRNRGAKIFRYILLDEIDLEYPTLNSEIVIREIKNGRIPLIIDGFDELLDKINIEDHPSKSFEEIETMLDTIGHLLEGSAKIVLTTRKTALFTGLEFEQWLVKWDNQFDVSRFSLREPRIKDWIGENRYKILSEKVVSIQYIANPVILTFLRNLSIEEFKAQLDNPELLVQQYFEKMLDREKERQNINITVEHQLEIFRNVARMLLELDITVESKEFFKEIILDQNLRLLEYTRSLYSGTSRPTIENLVDSLATHALLDRKGRDENQIGFINDFILGIFLGDVICASDDSKIKTDFSTYMVEIAATAYKVQNITKRELLWSKIQQVKSKFPLLSNFIFDLQLCSKLINDYEELSVYDLTFFNIDFNGKKISKTVFINCYFKSSSFDPIYFLGVSFINCTFHDCEISGQIYFDESSDISTIKCIYKNSHLIKADKNSLVRGETSEEISELEKDLLLKLWTISHTKGQHIIKLIHLCHTIPQKKVLSALELLEIREFIQIRGHHVYFNINKIADIKRIIKIDQNGL